ncbi:hypothetical protein BD410DRAFT_844516 [Rickenella mellea]|uniref:DH domain-containing protein n=1 Tax=Rickenella mellea TaxID=50990 RepID=A0A4Y7PN85_9AGAM|nr:hypothetical protein BD410DRAFT_844516 [Rickenella mellea]
MPQENRRPLPTPPPRSRSRSTSSAGGHGVNDSQNLVANANLSLNPAEGGRTTHGRHLGVSSSKAASVETSSSPIGTLTRKRTIQEPKSFSHFRPVLQSSPANKPFLPPSHYAAVAAGKTPPLLQHDNWSSGSSRCSGSTQPNAFHSSRQLSRRKKSPASGNVEEDLSMGIHTVSTMKALQSPTAEIVSESSLEFPGRALSQRPGINPSVIIKSGSSLPNTWDHSHQQINNLKEKNPQSSFVNSRAIASEAANISVPNIRLQIPRKSALKQNIPTEGSSHHGRASHFPGLHVSSNDITPKPLSVNPQPHRMFRSAPSSPIVESKLSLRTTRPAGINTPGAISPAYRTAAKPGKQLSSRPSTPSSLVPLDSDNSYKPKSMKRVLTVRNASVEHSSDMDTSSDERRVAAAAILKAAGLSAASGRRMARRQPADADVDDYHRVYSRSSSTPANAVSVASPAMGRSATPTEDLDGTRARRESALINLVSGMGLQDEAAHPPRDVSLHSTIHPTKSHSAHHSLNRSSEACDAGTHAGSPGPYTEMNRWNKRKQRFIAGSPIPSKRAEETHGPNHDNASQRDCTFIPHANDQKTTRSATKAARRASTPDLPRPSSFLQSLHDRVPTHDAGSLQHERGRAATLKMLHKRHSLGKLPSDGVGLGNGAGNSKSNAISTKSQKRQSRSLDNRGSRHQGQSPCPPLAEHMTRIRAETSSSGPLFEEVVAHNNTSGLSSTLILPQRHEAKRTSQLEHNRLSLTLSAERQRKAFGIPQSLSGLPTEGGCITHAESDVSMADTSWTNEGADEFELSLGAEKLFRGLSTSSHSSREMVMKGKFQHPMERREVHDYFHETHSTDNPSITISHSITDSSVESSSFYDDVESVLERARKPPVMDNITRSGDQLALSSWRATVPPLTYTTLLERHGVLEMRRQQVIWELSESEEFFLSDMRFALSHFVQPLLSPDRNWMPGVPTDVSRFFDWLDDIFQLHSQISSSLQHARASQYPLVLRVADCLRTFVSRFEVYQPYLVRLQEVTKSIDSVLEDSHSDFGEFIRMQSASERCEGNSFVSYLKLPLQRLVKYSDLFKKILDFTPCSHIDHLSAFSLFHSTNMVIRVMEDVKLREQEYLQIKVMLSGIDGLTVLVSNQLASRERKLLVHGVLEQVYINDESVQDSNIGNKLPGFIDSLPYISVYTIVLSDLVILATQNDPHSASEKTWRLLDHIGTSKILAISTLSGNNNHDHLLVLNVLPVDLDELESGVYTEKPISCLHLRVPADNRHDNNAPSDAFNKWREAFQKNYDFTVRSLSFPSQPGSFMPHGPGVDLEQDTRQSVLSILAAGLPLPKSPSLQIEDIQKNAAVDAPHQEREERGWWALRFQQVLREFQRQDASTSATLSPLQQVRISDR